MSSEYTAHEQFADSADDYLDKHDVYGLFGSLLKGLAIHKPKDPYSFMVSLLQQPQNTLKVVMVGKPGSGKNEQVTRVVEEFGVVPITVAGLLKEEEENKTALGAKAQSYLDKGEEVPAELYTQLIGVRVNKTDCVQKGWLLDGYPTTRTQAVSLQQSAAGILPNKFLWLQCEDGTAKARLSASDELAEGVTEEQVDGMYAAFQRHTKLFASLFECLTLVDAEGESDDVFASITRTLKQAALSKAPRRPMRVLCLGPTGAGKATQCRKLSLKFGLVHLSTGELLRSEAAKSEVLAEQIEPYMKASAMVPDEIVCPLVIKRLLQSDCRARGFVLDGFPRSAEQADALQASKLQPNRCVFLEVPQDVSLLRVLHRRVDPATGDVYSVLASTPPPGVAPRLITQDKDNDANANTLLMEYAACAPELKKRYGDIAQIVDGTQDEKQVSLALEQFLLASLGARRG